MSDEEKIKQAFIVACKYLQYNPPALLETPEEIRVCYGSNTYEDGWKQWASYFLNQVDKIFGDKLK